MVNEVMAKAITGIDDELITDAFNASAKKQTKKTLYALVSVAACLVLVFTAIFLSAPKSTEVFIQGEKITSSPLVLSSPLSAAALAPRVAQKELTVNLDVNFNKAETRITCSEGTFRLCGKNQDTLFYEGCDFTTDQATAKKDCSLYWSVENPDEENTYTLTLEGKKTQVLNLKYDENLQNWTIFIEK